MQAEQLPYWLAFNSIPKLNVRAVESICGYFGGNAAEAWWNGKDWGKIAALPGRAEEEILTAWRALSPEQLFSEFLNTGCNVVCLGDEDYPEALSRIYDPPLLLFYRGRLPAEEEICLALIGSRKASPYGYQVAEIFSRELAEQGVLVVSGMARGIDSVCHKAALAVGGETIAVLGSGIDVIYPPEHGRLFAQICEHGAVVSEFPLGMAALPQNFPRRNRIISGLSRGVLVIEADEKSGTLRTVDYALEQGRDVFAVPGSVLSATSRGTNRLLKEGAKMALSAADVWEEYSDAPLKKCGSKDRVEIKGNQLTSGEKKLLDLLKNPMRLEEILTDGSLSTDAATVGSMLTILEIRGYLRQLPGKYYQTIIKTIRA